MVAAGNPKGKPVNEGVGFVGQRVVFQIASRHRHVRWVGRAAGVAVVAALAVGVLPGVADAAPHNPSDGEISAAQHDADTDAAKAGQLAGQLAKAQADVENANARAALALDQFEGKQQAYEDAQAKAAAAAAAARKAQADLSDARAAVADFARQSYMSGSTSPSMEAVLTSGSPAQLLERQALLAAAGDHRSNVLNVVTVVERKAAAAHATAQTTLKRADVLKQQAQTALTTAQALRASAVQQESALQTQKSALDAQVSKDKQTVNGLLGQRAAADEYAKQQAAAEAAAEAAQPADTGGSGSGGSASGDSSASSGSGGGGSDPGPQAGPGSTSAAETAIAAAKRYVGTPYAWGGGTLSGPSRGYADGMGNDDSNVIGFDCSGLTRYAYAQAGIIIQRQSTMQYMTLPHVSGSHLQRGDLVFWAFDTSNPWTIHHVAIYLGDGMIIEAPESGMTVRVTSMRWTGFIGGARPSA
jgi:cell wall-associated NlpC family hydrolase